MPLLLEHLRSALRSLLRAPGYTAFAIALMTAGIGTTVAVFSLLHSVVLRPLPYAAPERLVGLSARNPAKALAMPSLSASDFRDYHARARSFATLAAFRPSFVSYAPQGGDAEQWVSALVTEDFFRVFGVDPVAGRLPRADEHALGSARVAVLSHAAWRRHFGARDATVGQTLMLDGEATLVIGVMPPSFREPEFVDVWLPFAPEAPENLARDSRFWTTVGRLAPRISVAGAAAEAAVLADALATEYPATNRGWTVSVQPLREMRVAGIASSLVLLLGAVGLVLLLACANLANLQLARGVSRLPEFAVRLALGASPRALAQVMLLESGIVALIGAVAGSALAALAVPAAATLLPTGLVPRSHAFGVDAAALAVALGAAVASGLLSGLLPAWQAWRTPVNALLKTGGARSGTGRFAQRAQNGLVVAQVALTLVVLATASGLARSLLTLERTDPGFNPRGVLAVRLAPPENRWQSLEDLSAYYDRVLTEIARLPGVRSAALNASAPLCGITLRYPFSVEGQAPSVAGADDAVFSPVSPAFLRTLGIPLLHGRDLEEADTRQSRKVCVINRTLAERLFPGADPLGRRIRIVPWLLSEYREIVGVVADVRQDSLADPPPPQVYVPQAQSPWFFTTLLVRAESGAGMARTLEAALRRIDPGVSFSVRSLEDNVALTTVVPRLRTTLFAVFGATALALSALGIYAGVAFSVGQRARELGVRLALGATPVRIFRDVLGRAGALALGGAALGLGVTLALAEVLQAAIHGMQPLDSLTLGVVAVGVPLLTLLACLSPATAAARLDPARALQSE
jgi:predicted permease